MIPNQTHSCSKPAAPIEASLQLLSVTKKAEQQEQETDGLDTDQIFNSLITGVEPFVEVVPVSWPGFKGLRIGSAAQALLELEYEPNLDQFYLVISNFKFDFASEFSLEPLDWRLRPDQQAELLTLSEMRTV